MATGPIHKSWRRLVHVILRELGDDDMDIDLAIQRMNTVRDDINTVLQALSRFSAPRRRKSTVVKSREPKEVACNLTSRTEF